MKNVHLNLIRKIAWGFHSTTGIDYAELFSEASLAYCEAELAYNPEKKTKFTTFAFSVIKNRLVDFCKEENKYQCDQNINDLFFGGLYEIAFEENTTQSFSKDLKDIIQIILSSPEDFANLMPKHARGHLVRILKQKGWACSRIWDNIREIKKNINEMEIGSIIIVNT